MKQEKKPTKGDLERRMKNAIVLVPKDKETQTIFFSNKGLRLTVTADYTVIETGFHRHVFSNITNVGYSRANMYIKRLIEIAYANDCIVKDNNGNVGYSYAKLIDNLNKKDDKTEYNIAVFVEWYLENIFAPLYRIGDDACSQFLVYFNYINTIATQSIILDENKDGLSNKQFLEKHRKLIEEFTKNMPENVILEPLSDEQRVKQEMEALQEQEVEQSQNVGNEG